MRNGLFFLAIVTVLCGFGDMRPTGFERVGSGMFQEPLRLGMSKGEVRSRWGEPDHMEPIAGDKLGLQREEWIYEGRSKSTAVFDYRFFYPTQRLVFEGDSLIKIGTERPRRAPLQEEGPVETAPAPTEE